MSLKAERRGRKEKKRAVKYLDSRDPHISSSILCNQKKTGSLLSEDAESDRLGNLPVSHVP